MPSSSEKHIHIISFDIPYPPDYGGVTDVFYKVRALTESGIHVHLHCYEYGRRRSFILEKTCYRVNYYRRETGLGYLFKKDPYIVATRNSPELSENLARNNYPVIYEGLHTTMSANMEESGNRLQIVRMHNREPEYYYNLYRNSGSLAGKIFFRLEAMKLMHYEKKLNNKLAIACISSDDTEYFRKKYSERPGIIEHIPPFHGNKGVTSLPGRGEYVLYHGNLSVCENERTVLFILDKIAAAIEVPLVIAGKNPSRKIIRAASGKKNVKLISNPNDAEMTGLLMNAQINLLPAENVSGMKLKLLNSLYQGRHCLVNNAMVNNTGLEKLCHIARSADDYIDLVSQLFHSNITAGELKRREAVLDAGYSNSRSLNKLRALLNLY
jgi:hypothetical protein